MEYIWSFPHGEESYVTVVVPELFRKPSLVSAVLRRTTFGLKRGLLREPGVVVADVPALVGADRTPSTPSRGVCLIPVADVNAASLRAVVYGRQLGLDGTTAVYFAPDEESSARFRERWDAFQPGVPLEIVETPYRDIGKPLLAHVRRITADPDAVAVVVMPELVVRGTDRFLHSQRALYIKRLLLFEPRVILTSVPYQLV
jgi:hypothetical protein